MPTTKAMKGDAASVCQGGSMLEPITGTFTADMALESDREGVVERSKGESVWRRARRRRGRSGAKLGGRGATQLRRAWSVVPGRARRTRVPFDSTVVRPQESESTRGAQPTGLRQRGQVGESRESGGRVRKRLDAPSAPSADRSHALVTGSGTQSSFRGSSVALSRRTCLGRTSLERLTSGSDAVLSPAPVRARPLGHASLPRSHTHPIELVHIQSSTMSPAPFKVVFVGAGEVRRLFLLLAVCDLELEARLFACADPEEPHRSTLVPPKGRGTTPSASKARSAPHCASWGSSTRTLRAPRSRFSSKSRHMCRAMTRLPSGPHRSSQERLSVPTALSTWSSSAHRLTSVVALRRLPTSTCACSLPSPRPGTGSSRSP